MFSQAFKVAILAVLLYFIYKYTRREPPYKFHKHHPGDCRQVDGIEFGSEDMEVTQDGLAFITSGFNFAPNHPNYKAFYVEKKIRGRIYLFDFKKPDLGARPLKVRPSKTFEPETFQPHGMSMLEDKVKGKHLLYVVNHVRGAEDRVEKFRFVPGVNELEHLRFFNDSAFRVLNNVAVTQEDEFYASNYLYSQSSLFTFVEHTIPLALGSLLYVDAQGVTEVVKGLNTPNGILLSANKRLLYVATKDEAIMRVYERKKGNGLKLVQVVPEVRSILDNFQLTPTGDALLTGAFPSLDKIAAYFSSPGDFKNPSSVLRLPLRAEGLVDGEEITELFYDHGDLINAATGAQIYNGQLLIGSIIDKLVVCDLYK